ncbi:TPA: DUF5060 domain-containing protein, partial [Candidatus Bathyarchaeota archaeon]|nr:DUF5060 domain-containing protein [Candidatus Bathyarchaeota archaeon]
MAKIHLTKRPSKEGLLVLAVVSAVACSAIAYLCPYIGRYGVREPKEEALTVRSVDSVAPNSRTVPRYGLFELTIDLTAHVSDPYDVRLDAVFISPSGREVVVGSFPSHGRWKVRFTPVEIGSYSYHLVADKGRGGVSTPLETFTCIESDRPGFIKISEYNGRYFVFDNGETFFPVGINKGWIFDVEGNRGDVYRGEGVGDGAHWDAERYFDEMSAHGINLVRVWMCSWHLDIESKKTGLGSYDEGEADRLDYLLRLCEKHNIRLMLVLLTFTDFSSIYGDKWTMDNPYCSANGGPCASPIDFFTDEEAKRYIKRRFGYIIDRWSYSPYIFSWELWNEVDLCRGVDEGHWLPWHEEMAEYIRQRDPYGHPITTSFCGDRIYPETYES